MDNEALKVLILDLHAQTTAATEALRQEMRQEMREMRTSLRQEMREGFAQVNDKIDRQVGGLRDELMPKFDLLAEGLLHLDEKIDREAADIRQEMRGGFSETHNLIRLAYKDLANP